MAEWLEKAIPWVAIAQMFVFLIWWFVCIIRTASQRKVLLEAVAEESYRRSRSKDFGERLTWETPFDGFSKLSHDRHVWMLMTFRDPYQVYPKYIRRLVGK